ncbi:MAG TPA: hypothetical protein VKY19_29675 [Ktedonosporobacter sp.]|jgi:cobalamin synthase|nr:hypothetical protein [Ktedonosporobacter sp.]
MNPVTLKRIAIAAAILTVLVAIDGLYMVLTNYHPDDTSNNGFGAFHPSDGQTVLIAAGLLLLVAIIAFVLSNRTQLTVGAAGQPAKQDVEPEVNA